MRVQAAPTTGTPLLTKQLGTFPRIRPLPSILSVPTSLLQCQALLPSGNDDTVYSVAQAEGELWRRTGSKIHAE